jgi:hypothetical protein
MTIVALLIAAASNSSGHSQSDPGTGAGIALIVGTVLLVAIVFGALFWTLARRSRASRGGVRHPPADGTRGAPPFESIERRHFPETESEEARRRPGERPRTRSAP